MWGIKNQCKSLQNLINCSASPQGRIVIEDAFQVLYFGIRLIIFKISLLWIDIGFGNFPVLVGCRGLWCTISQLEDLFKNNKNTHRRIILHCQFLGRASGRSTLHLCSLN